MSDKVLPVGYLVRYNSIHWNEPLRYRWAFYDADAKKEWRNEPGAVSIEVFERDLEGQKVWNLDRLIAKFGHIADAGRS